MGTWTNTPFKHVRSIRHRSALVVVALISLTKSDGDWIGYGGAVTLHEDPWALDDSMLEATVYRYSLIAKPAKYDGAGNT